MKNKQNPIEDLEPSKDSFIMYARWYKCVSAFSSKSQGLAFKAICEYALFDIPIPKVGFSHLEYCTLLSFLPILDSNRQRYENGKKGSEHGSKGGRPRKNQTLEGASPKTPEGLLNETPMGMSGNPPNEKQSVMNNSIDKKDADVDGNAMQVPVSTPPTERYIYNLLLPVFFFRNCNAPYEVGRFYKHYRLAEWRLSGGDVLDSAKKIITAAERWKVEDSKPFFPAAFINIWRRIYEMAPAELKREVVEIKISTRMQTSVTVVVSAILYQWLTSPEIFERFKLLQNNSSRPYKIELLSRKQHK